MTSTTPRRRTCANCGADFAARSTRARYCGDRCRSKARYRRISGAPVADLYGLPIPSESSDLADAVATELQAAGRAHTVAGVAALTIARRIDACPESSAGLATLTRELRACMAEALADAFIGSSLLDDLAEQRRQRRESLTR